MATAFRTAPKIFIVDDDRDIRENLGELLREEGFSVEAAWSGAEALKRLAAGFKPDLIILDLMMPGMDGIAFRARMKVTPALSAIPIIGITAFPAVRLDFKCLQKPFRFERLLAEIRATLP